MWPRSKHARLQQKQKCGRPMDPMGLRLYVAEAAGDYRASHHIKKNAVLSAMPTAPLGEFRDAVFGFR